jgi:hypothetical protein
MNRNDQGKVMVPAHLDAQPLTLHQRGSQTTAKGNSAMTAYASSQEEFNQRLNDLFTHVREELRYAVNYVDSVVVPEIRRESATAMRATAIHLEQWADKLDPQGRRDGPQNL